MVKSLLRTVLLLGVSLLAHEAHAFVAPSRFGPRRSAQPKCSTTTLHAGSPLDALKNIFAPPVAKEPEPEPQLPDVVIDPDFRLAGIFLAGGFFLDLIPYIQLTLGPLVTLLGVLFLVQTFRIRFVFDKDAFELKQGDGTTDTGENVVVGGANRWTYDSFVNYDFFPREWVGTPQGPILVYFKETQTPSDKWAEGPGEYANSEEAIAKGAVPGQVHFFPALCNTEQIQQEFEKRGCAKL
uniref:Uncharacterized protein n=1 Tax=Grammatophora oceanica TaxID=210454 RepID=A0A7S1V028_9STRA|mmetsp:Transcript_31513/g.46758  ORF Transcript_31513/g.46758 Transcript_31513/m.46758 type:complete len:239 (+) Transcript_31513:83-799(+)|eukprot:CAMPEP_0194049238 /NCGR_PEP_ID=MMETSP0009_2-20130614/30116_1 /TAXON_ID=210454 /ORGANISM="Grammatophora oceanica, Strain CCMP 410" /LENGTH=238 /DNA_ID=CAMNT_0038695345 /DNA_START=81 /DNA_END=797 /DNA_ORIENTATION=-